MFQFLLVLLLSTLVCCLDLGLSSIFYPPPPRLQDYIMTFKRALLVVSHDREFLNAISTDVYHLSNQVGVL